MDGPAHALLGPFRPLDAAGSGFDVGAGMAFYAAGKHPMALLLVVLALALNWFGDSLDGTLARVRNRQRPRYGFTWTM